MRSVFIAIPAYDQRINCLCMASIFNNIKDLEKRGHKVTFSFQLGDPYLDQARNHVVKQFLESEYDDLIFVDTDLAFDSNGMWRLTRCEEIQVVGGAYPYRAQDKHGYPVNIKVDENLLPVTDYERGLVECTMLPTGFLRIRRDVFDAIRAALPEYVDHDGEYKYFRTGQLLLETGDTRWWGEDAYFCRLCTDLGIKLWCEPMINFSHDGVLHKCGKFADYLQNGGKWPK
jgi:hypothetical protein